MVVELDAVMPRNRVERVAFEVKVLACEIARTPELNLRHRDSVEIAARRKHRAVERCIVCGGEVDFRKVREHLLPYVWK